MNSFSPASSGSSTPADNSVTSAKIVDGAIVNADINASAAIAYSKLSLGTSIATSDLAANAVTTAKLASGIPQSLTASGSSTAAIADTSSHIVGGGSVWNGTGWIAAGRPDYYNAGSNANIARTIPRTGIMTATIVIGGAGVMTSYAIELYAGMVITNINFRIGSTAATWGSNNDGHWFVALYDTQATPALIAQSADGGHTGLGTGSNTVALASPAPYTVTTTGTHYVSLMVNTGTGGSPVQPTLTGMSQTTTTVTSGIASGQKTLSQTSGSALTATAPGTITSASVIQGIAYIETN